MNMEEKDIDQLTRNLMRGTVEQPSSFLNERVMARLMEEKKAARRVSVNQMPSLRWILIIVGVLYMIVVAGMANLLFGGNEGQMDLLMEKIKRFFPLLLTVFGSVSFFFLLTQLDMWLYNKRTK